MLNKSQFRDYYDYVAHLYGGGDPSCVYVRKRIVEREFHNGVSTAGNLDVTQKGIVKLPYIDSLNLSLGCSFKWLSVCGKYYLLISEDGFRKIWSVYTPEKYPKIASIIGGKRSRWSIEDLSVGSIGVFSTSLLELSRKFNAPVFTLSNLFWKNIVNVDGEIPILGDIGFASIINAQQIYQDLSYFMANIIKTSPDLGPVNIISDEEKILQHGFDIRQSFRHRV